MSIANTLRRLGRDEEGQSLTEYALVMGLIAVVCVGALGAMGTNINGMLQGVAGSLKGK